MCKECIVGRSPFVEWNLEATSGSDFEVAVNIHFRKTKSVSSQFRSLFLTSELQ